MTDPHPAPADLFSTDPGTQPASEPVTPDSATEHAPVLPPAYPDRAAWGTATPLRAWQAAALDKYFAEQPRDLDTAMR